MANEETTEVVLGRTYRDKVTGLVGVATVMHEHLNGMVQYTIEPYVDKEGKMQEAYNIDAGNLVDVETEVPVAAAPAGGPTTKAVR